MSDDRATLSQLLDTALELPAEAREPWIEALADEHAALKPRLRALIARAARIETSDFLQTLPKIGVEETSDPGDLVGPYRLIREIGAGGMGSVWLAERDDGVLKRPVALKFLRASGPHEALAERLQRERDILATLVHPGIARLYDAGIAGNGLPYLALEYVEGEHIDQYCGSRQLDVRARVALVLQVASAVAYAHSKLVVHRDLKPTNVLVSADGQAHLLDFGIAKLLEDGRAVETRLTQMGGKALTPEYASPEQILGQPVTTASDVYSLGVILYELLTDTRPYTLKRESRGALEDAILEADPQRPSERVGRSPAGASLARALRGDLDAIALKALKKAPDERYRTMDAFADDLARFVSGRAVLAQADSRWYRARKFVSRNKLAVGSASAVALALVVAFGVATWQMLEARAQRDVAEAQRERLLATNDFLNLLLDDVGSGSKPVSIAEALDRSTELMERQYETNEPVFAKMLYDAALRYASTGKVERELALLERVAGSALELGDVDLYAASRCSMATELVSSDLARAQSILTDSEQAPTRPQLSANATWICDRARAALREAQGDDAGAMRILSDALASPNVAREMPVSTRTTLLSDLGNLQFKNDQVGDALASLEETLQLFEQSGRGESMSMVITLMNHAAVLTRAGEVRQALDEQRRAFELVKRFESDGQPPIGFSTHLATSLLRLEQYEDALRLARSDVERAKGAGNLRYAAIGELLSARLLVHLGRHQEAEKLLASAAAAMQANTNSHVRNLNEIELTRADSLLARGELTAARASVDAVLAGMEYPFKKQVPGLASALYTGAKVALAQRDFATAERFAADAMPLEERTARDRRFSANYGQAALNRALALEGLTRIEDAREEARRAHEALSHGFGEAHSHTRQARELLIRRR